MTSWTNATAAPPAVGLLRPEVNDALVRRDRIGPAPGLAPWVEHYWTVAWELDDPGFVAEVISHPSLHVTVETGSRPRFGHQLPAGLVHGVITRRFSQEISGTGRVFGVKFHPGGFGAFTGADVGAWTDRVCHCRRRSATALETWCAACSDSRPTGRAPTLRRFLLDRAPGRDERYDEVLAVVRDIQDDPTLPASSWPRGGMHVGAEPAAAVPPLRWRRTQVGAAARAAARRGDRIDAGQAADLASLALELGWFDQAHFTRDFTALVGQSPAAYAARRERG